MSLGFLRWVVDYACQWVGNSLALPPTIPSLGLVVGLTIIDTLEKFGCPSIKIKWPNDVFFDQKK